MNSASLARTGRSALSAKAQAYQTELQHKLAQAQQQPDAAHWLALRRRGVAALLPLRQIGAVFPPAPLHPLPMAQDWVQGVASWHGDVYLVIDWVQMLNLAERADFAHSAKPAARTPLAEPAYWVGFSPALGKRVALQADVLLGLRRTHDCLPAAAADTGAPAWRKRRGIDGTAWLELDLAQWAQTTALPDWLLPPFAQRRAQAVAPQRA